MSPQGRFYQESVNFFRLCNPLDLRNSDAYLLSRLLPTLPQQGCNSRAVAHQGHRSLIRVCDYLIVTEIQGDRYSSLHNKRDNLTGNIHWNGCESRQPQFRKIPDQFLQGCSFVMVLKLMLLSLNDIYRQLQDHVHYL